MLCCELFFDSVYTVWSYLIFYLKRKSGKVVRVSFHVYNLIFINIIKMYIVSHIYFRVIINFIREKTSSLFNYIIFLITLLFQDDSVIRSANEIKKILWHEIRIIKKIKNNEITWKA